MVNRSMNLNSLMDVWGIQRTSGYAAFLGSIFKSKKQRNVAIRDLYVLWNGAYPSILTMSFYKLLVNFFGYRLAARVMSRNKKFTDQVRAIPVLKDSKTIEISDFATNQNNSGVKSLQKIIMNSPQGELHLIATTGRGVYLRTSSLMATNDLQIQHSYEEVNLSIERSKTVRIISWISLRLSHQLLQYWGLIRQIQSSYRDNKWFVGNDDFTPFFFSNIFYLQIEIPRYKRQIYNIVEYARCGRLKYSPFIHDLIPLLPPPLGSPQLFKLYKEFVQSITESTTCFVPSLTTKSDLIRLSNIEEHKVVIAKPPSSILSLSRESCLPDFTETKFFLSVNSLIPRKNYHRLIGAFENAQHNSREKYALIIVAGEKSNAWSTLKLIASSRLKGSNIRVISKLSDCCLHKLYLNCSGLLYISTYEGYGIPIVDAQNFGTLALVSDVGSMKEIGQSGGCILVDPYSVSDISNALVKIMNGQRESFLEFVTVDRDKIPNVGDFMDLIFKTNGGI
jgi:glycosyltransferase involved in cell wall biosynthesis